MAIAEDFSTIAFLNYFSDIEDPRLDRHKLYPLNEIFLTTLCAKICDAESWEDIQDFGEAKLEFLRNYLPYENGIPSHDTLARVFSLIDPKQFKNCFVNWVENIQKELPEFVSIDGKTLRGSYDNETDQKAIHMVSAFASNTRLVLGQEKVKEKSNEITAIPKLLEVLFLKGAVVTIDAMGCQKTIAEKIREKGADYLLALKGNQGDLNNDVRTYFEGESDEKLDVYKSYDKGHGRIEIRQYKVSQNIDWIEQKSEWKDLKCIVEVDSIRIIKDKETNEKRYFISSLEGTAEEIGKAIRSHWSVENQLHWVLDVTFNEDKSRIRKRNGPENMAIIKHVVLNLIRQNNDNKTSLKRRRRRAIYRDDYLAQILKVKF
jgi:predicted transposase YbfD/YdcC